MISTHSCEGSATIVGVGGKLCSSGLSPREQQEEARSIISSKSRHSGLRSSTKPHLLTVSKATELVTPLEDQMCITQAGKGHFLFKLQHQLASLPTCHLSYNLNLPILP